MTAAVYALAVWCLLSLPVGVVVGRWLRGRP